jgi:hypothetical protein
VRKRTPVITFLDDEIARNEREDKRLIRHFSQRGDSQEAAAVATLSGGVIESASAILLIKTIVIATLLSTSLLAASLATVPLAPLAVATNVEPRTAQRTIGLSEKDSRSSGHAVPERGWTKATELCQADSAVVEMPLRRPFRKTPVAVHDRGFFFPLEPEC